MAAEMMKTMIKIREDISEKVHNNWVASKLKEGFHAPIDCKSHNANAAIQHEMKSLDFYTFPKHFEFCPRCKGHLYPYSELSDNMKEKARIVVDNMLNSIWELVEEKENAEEKDEDSIVGLKSILNLVKKLIR